MENLTFKAIDFEIANPDYSSICQIGIVTFERGEIVNEESFLINPETDFHGMNISIHGITPAHVEGKPTFSEFFPELHERINNQVLVHHQPFDYSVYSQACDLHGLIQSDAVWIDSAAVVRRTWEQFAYRGYGLKNVANFLGIDFIHHDACEDARVCGQIFVEACKKSGKTIKQWEHDVNKRLSSKRKYDSVVTIENVTAPIEKYSGITDNYFSGKKIVVSGTYSKWPNRNNLIQILKTLGATVTTQISRTTNILCAGIGVGPSKFKKMQENIEAGKEAEILNEAEILEILMELEQAQKGDT